MIFIHRGTQSVHYSYEPFESAYVICENGRHTTVACGTEAEAKAVCQALNFQRLLAEARPLMLAKPSGQPGQN